MKRLVACVVLWLTLCTAAANATITTAYTPLSYDGNDASTTFVVSWPFVSGATDLVVTLVTSSGAVSTLTYGTDYTTTGGAGSTGTVEYPVSGDPLATGEDLRIERNVATTQPTAFPAGGRFRPSSVEDALDRLALVVQQFEEKLDRAPKFGSAYTGYTSPELPPPSDGSWLRWTGGDFENFTPALGLTASDAAIQSYFEGTGAATAQRVKGVWYVSTSAAITDHAVAGTAGSLAHILNQIGANDGTVVLTGNTTYSLGDDVTIPAGVALVFRHGAQLGDADDAVTITWTAGCALWASPSQQIFGTSLVHTGFADVREAYPEWWGVVGGGIADDTTAGQKAVDVLAASGGGELVFLQDTYKLNLVTKTEMHLRGGHRGVTLIPAADAPVIRFDQTDNVVRAKVSSLIIDGSATEVAYTSQDGINLEPGSGYFHDMVVLEDLRIVDCGRNGIRAIGIKPSGPSQFVQNLTVRNSKLMDSTKSGLYLGGTVLETLIERTIVQDNGSDSVDADSNLVINYAGSGERPSRVHIRNSTINVPTYTGGFAVAALAYETLIFEQCDFEQFKSAFKFAGATSESAVVRNCRFTSTAGAITSVAEMDYVQGFVWASNSITNGTAGPYGLDFSSNLTAPEKARRIIITKDNDWGGLTLPFSELPRNTISSGVLTLYRFQESIPVLGEGAADDQLDSILDQDGGHELLPNGIQITLYSTNSAADITVKDGTGNINVNGDFVLDRREDSLTLVWLKDIAEWVQAGGSDNTTDAGENLTGVTFFAETSEPDVAPANEARLFAKDNGSGKTQLCARFSSGASQCFATQP